MFIRERRRRHHQERPPTGNRSQRIEDAGAGAAEKEYVAAQRTNSNTMIRLKRSTSFMLVVFVCRRYVTKQ